MGKSCQRVLFARFRNALGQHGDDLASLWAPSYNALSAMITLMQLGRKRFLPFSSLYLRRGNSI